MSARRSSASSGSSAAASASAAAAAAASAAPARARGRSTHSGGAATSTSSNGHARVIVPATPASAATSLSGHKRPATASAGSSSSAAAASASSAAPSSDQSASNVSQTKKPRGDSSKQSNGSSAAAAASSVGLDPLPTPSRRSAASSAAASAASSSAAAQPSSELDDSGGSGDDDKSDESDDESDDRQERKPAASASSRRIRKPRAPKPHRLFREAAELIRGALPFAERQLSDEVSKRVLADARKSVQDPASANAIKQLGLICDMLYGHYLPKLPDVRDILRDWLLKADTIFTQLVLSLPQMQLSRKDGRELSDGVIFAGALQAIPALVHRLGFLFPSHTPCGVPLLTQLCRDPANHVVSLQPYLRLFEFGLDPNEDGDPLSALQLARDFVRDHAASPAPIVSGPLALMQAAAMTSEPQSIPSVLFAAAIQHREASPAAETLRRNALHARFMHELVSVWRSHSDKVRSMLLKAAPGRLIPPLVDVVSRYLDLEGVPPERSAPAAVDDAAEMA